VIYASIEPIDFGNTRENHRILRIPLQLPPSCLLLFVILLRDTASVLVVRSAHNRAIDKSMTSFVSDSYLPTYEPAHEELLFLCEANATNLIANCNPLSKNAQGEAWVPAPGNDRPDLQLRVFSSREPNSSLKRWLGVCKFPGTDCVELMRHFNDLQKRLTWDKNCTNLQTHDLYSWPVIDPSASADAAQRTLPLENTLKFLRCTTAAHGPISARDFVDVNYLRHDVDLRGKCYAVVSCGGVTSELANFHESKHPDVYPVVSGVVRGITSGGCGWYIEQDRDPRTGEYTDACAVSYVIHSDIKGWLPTVLINSTVGGTFADFFQAVKQSRLTT